MSESNIHAAGGDAGGSTRLTDGPSPLLLACAGPFEGRTVALDDRDVTIGRHASNRLVLRDIAVSRHHAVVRREGDGFSLRDLDSRHGTIVGDGPVRNHRLRDGDRIVIGGSTFVFVGRALDLDGEVSLDDSTWLGDSTVALDAEEARGAVDSLLGSASFDRTRQRLEVVLDAAQALPAAATRAALAARLLEDALRAIPAERAALLFTGDRPGGEESAFERSADGPADLRTATSRPLSRTVAARVAHQRVALLANDVHRRADLGEAASLEAARVAAVLCVPLVGAGDDRPVAALLYLDDRRPTARFTEEDLRLLSALAAIAAPTVESLRRLAWAEGERRRLLAESLDHDMVGESASLARVLAMIARVAPTETTVLIRGESGTGKELAAQAVHRASPRRERPFVAINCATLTGELLESELFGHERGAFTGAVARKLGKIETAHTGTLFLDEVGEMPLATQAKLLRVLQQRTFERVGGTRPIEVDVRVVAATNRDLEAAIREGTFREDLYYRLDVVTVTLPALRDRREDVPRLVTHFATLHAARLKRPTPTFSARAQRLLERHDWPGNVRELSNAIERALVLAEGDTILPEDLPDALLDRPPEDGDAPSTGFHDAVREAKKRLIADAVRAADGNVAAAARALDLHPNYLHRLISNLGLRDRLA